MSAEAGKTFKNSPVVFQKTGFLLLEGVFLLGLAFWGGPVWVSIVVPALLIEVYCGSQLHSLGMLIPCSTWLVFANVTGNRELYFPFAMYGMAFMVSRLWEKGRGVAVLGGFLCGVFFLTIRWLQQASMSVLLVEGVVAASILFVLCLYYSQGLDRGWPRMLSLVGASLLAYAGLAL